jgi:penicillin amidase
MREAVTVVYSDDLGGAFDRYLDYRALALIRLLEGRATSRDWCDNRTTPERETCAAAFATGLDRALRDLEDRYGKDRSRWRWGKSHRALSEHRAFGSIAFLGLDRFFNVEVDSAGGNYTLNRGQADLHGKRPFANKHAAGFRAIYDLADLERSLYIQATGQSGNPFSPFYRSFARRWAEGKYIEIPTRREAITKTLLGTWVLTPQP